MNSMRFDFKGMELVKGNIKVRWEYIGEGWEGDYNEGNPDDEPLLRFEVQRLEDGEWHYIEHSSFCSQFKLHSTEEQKRKGLEILMNSVYEPASQGHSIKKLCERLSWMNTHGNIGN